MSRNTAPVEKLMLPESLHKGGDHNEEHIQKSKILSWKKYFTAELDHVERARQLSKRKVMPMHSVSVAYQLVQGQPSK